MKFKCRQTIFFTAINFSSPFNGADENFLMVKISGYTVCAFMWRIYVSDSHGFQAS